MAEGSDGGYLVISCSEEETGRPDEEDARRFRFLLMRGDWVIRQISKRADQPVYMGGR